MRLFPLYCLAAAGLGALAPPGPAAAQPGAGDRAAFPTAEILAQPTASREHVILVATLDCFRLRQGPSPPEVAAGLVEAFATPRFGNSPLPNPHIGRWDCRFRPRPPKGWSCSEVPGAPVRLLSRSVRLDFAVIGNCATFVFPGRNAVRLGPNRVGVRLGQSQILVWRVLVDVGNPLARREWGNRFEVRLAPPAARD